MLKNQHVMLGITSVKNYPVRSIAPPGVLYNQKLCKGEYKVDTKVTVSMALAFSVVIAGCGFKSDLRQAGDNSAADLFKADQLPEVRTPEFQTIEQTMNPLSVDEDIMIDKVTTEATEGRILITPENDLSVDISGELGEAVELDTTSSTPAAIDISSSVAGEGGIVVDISELERELEENRRTQ